MASSLVGPELAEQRCVLGPCINFTNIKINFEKKKIRIFNNTIHDHYIKIIIIKSYGNFLKKETQK